MYRKLLHLLYETGPSLLAKYIVTFGKRRDRVNSCVNYQPLPWIGLNQSRRTQGTLERWELMKPFIRTPGSLLDIGCSVGYFVFKAAEMGCLAWGVDSDLESHVLSNYAKKKANFDNVQFFKGVISTNDVETLPRFDYILYLSVFHHWCLEYGFEESKFALGRLIARAQKGFFFEMGQEEMSPKYNIPGMNGDPKAWLESLLKDSSEGRSVAYLGDAEVFVNKGKDKAYRLIYFVGE